MELILRRVGEAPSLQFVLADQLGERVMTLRDLVDGLRSHGASERFISKQLGKAFETFAEVMREEKTH